MGSLWPRHPSRGAGQQGLRLLVLPARRRCGENPPTPEVAQGGRSPAVVSGTSGRGLKTKLLLLCPIALVPVGLVESRSFACSPTPRSSLWPTAVSWPLVLWKDAEWPPPGREAEGEQWGVGLRCGVPRRRRGQGPAPGGASCACSSLLSFVPPQRRGCRESGFLPGTGLIHGPPEGRRGGGAGMETTLGAGVLEGAGAG